MARVASFSHWSEFSRTEEPETDDNMDTDLVTATASDADSSGDLKIVAKSVEGEDDIVDVIMKKATTGTQESAPPEE